MADSLNVWSEWLDTGEVRQDVNKVTEDAIKRVQEQGKKAKQAQQAIKKDKDENGHLSEFLSFLLKNVVNDKLIVLLYNTFFKVKHPQSNITYLRKNINTRVIVGIFVPFYKQKAEEYKVMPFYASIIPAQSFHTIADFVDYLKKLSWLYHDNVPLDKDTFIQFLTEMVMIYTQVYTDKENLERKQYIQLELSKFLYKQ